MSIPGWWAGRRFPALAAILLGFALLGPACAQPAAPSPTAAPATKPTEAAKPGVAPTTAPASRKPAPAAGDVLRLGHAAATTHPFHDGAERFAAAAEKATDGALKFQVFPARQLGDDAPLLQQVQLGAVDAAIVSSAVVAGAAPALNALQLPFLVPSYDVAATAYTSESAVTLMDKLGDIKLKGLAFYEGGFRHFLSSKGPINVPADFGQLKTRVVPVPLHLETWEALGGNPTPMAYGEVYTGLQTRVIDSSEINVSSVFGEKFYEVAKHFTLTGHYMWPGALIMNADRFSALPAEQQKALIQAAHESVRPQVLKAKEDDQKQLEQLKQQGLQVYEVRDITPFRANTQPVVDKYGGMDPVIKDFVEEVRHIAGTR